MARLLYGATGPRADLGPPGHDSQASPRPARAWLLRRAAQARDPWRQRRKGGAGASFDRYGSHHLGEAPLFSSSFVDQSPHGGRFGFG